MSSKREELVIAKNMHQLFKSRLRGFIDGDPNINVDTIWDHTLCNLGKWINNTGKTGFTNFDEIQVLDQVHQKIHATAQEIVNLKRTGNIQQAEDKMDEIYDIGDTIMDIIDKIEAKI